MSTSIEDAGVVKGSLSKCFADGSSAEPVRLVVRSTFWAGTESRGQVLVTIQCFCLVDSHFVCRMSCPSLNVPGSTFRNTPSSVTRHCSATPLFSNPTTGKHHIAQVSGLKVSGEQTKRLTGAVSDFELTVPAAFSARLLAQRDSGTLVDGDIISVTNFQCSEVSGAKKIMILDLDVAGKYQGADLPKMAAPTPAAPAAGALANVPPVSPSECAFFDCASLCMHATPEMPLTLRNKNFLAGHGFKTDFDVARCTEVVMHAHHHQPR